MVSFKNFSILDLILLELFAIAFALFFVSVWPTFGNWIIDAHWAFFLAAWIVLLIKPIISVFKAPKEEFIKEQ